MKGAPHAAAEQIRLRGALLGKDKDLLLLHRTLVRGGILSEEEFWLGRTHLLACEQALAEQRRAAPAAALVQPAAGAPRADARRIILTPDTIFSILSANAALHRAYSETVLQGRMGEKDFWTYYVQSRFFATPADGQAAPPAGGEYNPLDAYYVPPRDGAPSSAAQSCSGAPAISRLVDVQATVEDHFSDYGNSTAQQRAGEAAAPLLHRCNQQAASLVGQLDSSPAVQGALPISIEEAAADLDDLHALQRATLQPLDAIGGRLNARIRFAPMSPSAAAPGEERCTADGMRGPIDMTGVTLDIGALARAAFASQEAASEALASAARSLPTAGEAAALGTAVPSDVAIFHVNALEILRHFWACQPPSTQERREKSARMAIVLQEFLVRGAALPAQAREGPADGAAVAGMLGGLLDAIRHAIAVSADGLPR